KKNKKTDKLITKNAQQSKQGEKSINLFEKINSLSRVFLCWGGRKCFHAAASHSSQSRKPPQSQQKKQQRWHHSAFTHSTAIAVILLRHISEAAAECRSLYFAVSCMEPLPDPSVPPTVSPFAPECAPTSGVTAAPSCAMISAVGAFVSAVAGVPADGCCVPSPCTMSPVSASTV
ncbi:hypothetical protein TcG_13231, partial [Trypanosoma cruzi]